jgi:thiamine biosynthesis lipoprotein
MAPRSRRRRIPCSYMRSMPLRLIIVCLSILLVAAGAGCGGNGTVALNPIVSKGRHEFTHDSFGRTIHVTFYTDSPPRAEESIATAKERLAELALKLDPSAPEGELARFCAGAGGPADKVSDDLFLLMQQSLMVATRTKGAFDPTAPPIAALWRTSFTADKLPAAEAFAEARALAGWRKLQADAIERRARLLLPGMQVYFGDAAIAYAADRTLDELARHGVTAAFVDAGTVKVASNAPPGTKGWPVTLPGVPKPRTIYLRNNAVALAGDGDRAKVINGRSFTDRVDPRTGLGVGLSGRLARYASAHGSNGGGSAAVTVTAVKAFPASLIAAAAVVLGPEAAGPFLRTVSPLSVEFRPAAP